MRAYSASVVATWLPSAAKPVEETGQGAGRRDSSAPEGNRLKPPTTGVVEALGSHCRVPVIAKFRRIDCAAERLRPVTQMRPLNASADAGHGGAVDHLGSLRWPSLIAPRIAATRRIGEFREIPQRIAPIIACAGRRARRLREALLGRSPTRESRRCVS